MLRQVGLDDAGRVKPPGVLAWGQGASLSRFHPEFRAALEPAIEPVVVELAEHWGFVTYSSCDGHVVAPHECGEYSESYCGTVVFTDAQESATKLLLERSMAGFDSGHLTAVVRLRPLLGPVSQHRAVDLLFARSHHEVPWNTYVAERDRCIDHVCRRLSVLRGADDDRG